MGKYAKGGRMSNMAPRANGYERLLLFLRRNNPRLVEISPPDDVATLADRSADEIIEPVALKALEGQVAALPADRARMLVLRWGLDGGAPLPRASAAKKLGVSLDRAAFFERRALRSLGRKIHVPQPSLEGAASFYTGDDPYGRTTAAPIRIDGLDRQVAYLATLVHEQSGRALIFQRRQSIARPGLGPLDVYEIVTSGGEYWDELVIDGYGAVDAGPARPPPGYIFRSQFPVELRPEPNRGNNRRHRDFPLAFLRQDEGLELYRRRHVPKIRMFGDT